MTLLKDSLSIIISAYAVSLVYVLADQPYQHTIWAPIGIGWATAEAVNLWRFLWA